MTHAQKFPVAFKTGVVFCETQEEAHMLKEAQYIRRSQKTAEGFTKPRLAEIRHLCTSTRCRLMLKSSISLSPRGNSADLAAPRRISSQAERPNTQAKR